MYPVLFSIGKFKLYSFGSFIALGTLVAGYFLYRATRSRKLPTGYLFDVALYSVLSGLIGARLGYYLLYQDQFHSVWQVLYFWQGGLVALTGLLAGFATYLYLIRRERVPLWTMLDIGLLALLFGWAVGKFGCHLSACTAGKLGGVFTVNGLYPVDLYSSLWAVLSGFVLLTLWRQQKLGEGVVFFLAAEALLLGELVLKTLKVDFGQGVAQLETVIYLLLIVGVYLFFWRLHGPKIDRSQLASSLKGLVRRRRSR
jgi:phosphatidylglycerol---prolipoprotein diacylglyceryl transferase